MAKFSNAPIIITTDELNKYVPHGFHFSYIEDRLYVTIANTSIVAPLYPTKLAHIEMPVGQIATLGQRQFLPLTKSARNITDNALWNNTEYLETGHWHCYTDPNVRSTIAWDKDIDRAVSANDAYAKNQTDKILRAQAQETTHTLAKRAFAYAFTGATMARVQTMLDNTASLPKYKQQRLADLYANRGTKSGMLDVALLAAPKTPAQNRAIIKALKELAEKQK